LIEVAIVVVIGGILLSSAAALLLNYTKQVQMKATERKLDSIDEALNLFLQLNGRYPCPAATLPIDDANFGREMDCDAPPAGTAIAGAPTRVPRQVVMGEVPVRTVNLPDDFIGDSWGARFTFAVTRDLARNNYNVNEGAIDVMDSNGNSIVTPIETAHYAVISHGPNNSGAIPLQAQAALSNLPCPAGVLEQENCDGDAIFISTLIGGTANNAQFIDDIIRYRTTPNVAGAIPRNAVMAFNASSCPNGWLPFVPANRRFIVGTEAGTYNLGDTEAAFGIATQADAEEITLTANKTPFQISTTNEINPASLVAVGAGVPFATGGPPTESFDNRPPFIALLYCEKS